MQAPSPCILDWSERMTRAEEDLSTVVVITVINDRLLVPAEEIVALLAPRLEVEAESLVLRRVSSLGYLLLLSRLDLAVTLTDRWLML
jgi:hypothetical protein